MMRRFSTIAVVMMAAFLMPMAASQSSAEEKAKSEVYGFVMTDIRYDTEAIDPQWFDVVRPSKLPTVEDGFGQDGSIAFSARQTRFGIKSWLPTDMGTLKTQFEWELFGVGVDAGQTTIRLRHAYGELGHFGFGQTWSPFMDIDEFPNSVEYWGPTGMPFFRNVQARWMPIQGDTRMTIAIERPGASGDQGIYADRNELAGIQGRFPFPDVSAEYRSAHNWGYVELAGILRYIEWDDNIPDAFDFSDNTIGWGAHLSTNLKFGDDSVLRAGAVYGEGIENYMNDSPVDVGTEANPGDPTMPIKGVTLPIFGLTAFLDHRWSAKATSTFGYSLQSIDNSEGQADNAFHEGHYALANVMFYPVPQFMLGPEVQWDKRVNKAEGPGSETVDNVGFQFSAKYSFSTILGGGD